MLTYALRRILVTIPVMIFVALFVFSLLFLTPGDPAALIAGDQASASDIARIRETLGLDRPFLVQFGEWGWRILHGDLGTSIFTHLPVTHLISQRIEPTLSLLLLTLVIAVLCAVPLGVLAAWRHGSLVDRAAMVVSVLGFSLPVFVVGYLLAYVFALRLRWLPVQGFTSISVGVVPFLASLILPALALALLYIALIARGDAGLHAGGSGAGLRAHRAREGRGAERHSLCSRAEERGRADRHGDRLWLRRADQRRGGDGERVRHPRHRAPSSPTPSCGATTPSSRAWFCCSPVSTS